jgi:hypothetical protein
MTARITSRELMIVAIALAALLDFSANCLAAHALVSARDILVEQYPHSARKTPRRISSAAITCSRRTDGKWSRNSSRS